MDFYESARRFLVSIEKTQWLSPADLARYQASPIERLCRHAALNSPFNATRLEALFDNGDAATGRFRFDRWLEVPTFSRADAQPVNDLLHALSVPEVTGSSHEMQTSGSTGRPLTFRRSGLADIAGLATTALAFKTHGFDPDAPMGWIRSPETGQDWTERRTKGWTIANLESELFILSKAASTREALDWLRRVRPRYLMSPPSYVGGMIDDLRFQGGEPIALDRVFVTSEAPADGLAQAVEATFGAQLVDSYGAREVGEIACTCPGAGPAKHVAAGAMLVEIVKPDGSIAAPGEMGAVVVTPFYNYATPFIRYDIGDFAIQGAPQCACGRRTPLIERVLGRQHALFRFKDGSTRYPVGMNAMIPHLACLQMQIAQTHLDRVEVRYVADPRGGPADFAAATRVAHRILPLDVRVEFTAVERIEYSPSGKFEDILCLVRP